LIPSIHPFSILLNPIQDHGETGGYPSCYQAKSKVHPGQQSIAGPCTLTLTRRVNAESSVNLTCMIVDGGRKLEYQQRINACTGKTCKLHTERPQLRFKVGTFLL